MNQTVEQLHYEYQDDLKDLLGKYQIEPGPFEDNLSLEDFIMRAEILKTLISLYSELSHIEKD